MTRYLSSIPAIVVLLHSLFTAPLLVECIAADGRYFIEILGHDPCHHPGEGSQFLRGSHFGTRVVSSASGESDPCVDLMLENSSANQTFTSSDLRPLQAWSDLIHSEEADGCALIPAWNRETGRVSPAVQDPVPYSLRI